MVKIAPTQQVDENLVLPNLPSTVTTQAVVKAWIKSRVALQILRVAISNGINPISALKALNKLRQKYRQAHGEPMLTKIAKVDGKYYWRLGAPGFPSKASWMMHDNELNRLFHFKPNNGLRTLFLAITKKCPLNCEHCFEWENLNQPETLSADEIIKIVHKYQDYGATQIMFSGGEPMLRINDIYKILKAVKSTSDFWIITSGLGLNDKRAKKLKELGLNGVMISLDHFDAKKHNAFRGYPNSYDQAIQAVVSAQKAKLVVTLSICTTNEFVSEQNIKSYMDLAKHLGVSFVQFIEPRKKGRYRVKDVLLTDQKIEILEQSFKKYNTDPDYSDYPIINYIGYHQRRIGCFGAGNRFFYIDTDGDAHVCPFCEGKVCNSLKFSAEDTVNLLSDYSCPVFAEDVLF